MRIDLEVLSSFDLIITTSASDSDCVSVNVNRVGDETSMAGTCFDHAERALV